MLIAIVVIVLLLVYFSYNLGYKVGVSDCYKYLMKELKKHKNDEAVSIIQQKIDKLKGEKNVDNR